MTSRLAREVRCKDVLEYFAKRRMSFFTFTTRDVVTYPEIRKRWRELRHHLVRKYAANGLKYVMNFELHPKGHGWHVHCVFNDYINLRGGGLRDLRRFGFGMINCRTVTSVGVASYLSKHCLKAYRGVRSGLRQGGGRLRLVNTSRGLPRLSDYHWTGDHLARVRAFLRRPFFVSRFGSLPFRLRYSYADLAVLHNWSVDDLWKRLSGVFSYDDVF